MKPTRWLRFVSPTLLMLLTLAPPVVAQCHQLYDCVLVWSDEFDGTAVDARKWEFMIGDGTSVGLPSGWGNNELQYYQAENATVADGLLTLTAREEAVGGLAYTSARLRSLGKGDWQYGRMEMRAKMPTGKGLWPAFWMLPSRPATYGTWAASGEIDVVEYVGSEPDRVFGTIHYGSPWPNNLFSSSEYILRNGTFDKGFHVFAVEWERGEIRWYVDGTHYATQQEWSSTGGPFPAPFDVEFHLLLNLAVGGNLPGAPDASTQFPQELVVDYVRVYQPAAVKGTQVGATGLAYESPVRMKQIDASLAMSFENQSRKRDEPRDARRLWCTVTTRGTRAALAPKGTVRMRLGGTAGSSAWQGRQISAGLGRDGSAIFTEEEIGQLVAEAEGEGATIEQFLVIFDGSGGKKVTELTLDCLQASAGAAAARGLD